MDIGLPKSQQNNIPTTQHFLRCTKLPISWKFCYFERDQSSKPSPLTPRPTLPNRHKNSQTHTAPSLSCPCCCQRLLDMQVDAGIKMAHQGSLQAKGRARRNGPREEQAWKCTKRTNLYFDKQINYSRLWRKVSELNERKEGRSRMKRGKKKKSDANVKRKFGIIKWSQSPGKKRWEVNILSWRVGKVVFPTSTRKMDFERH